MNRLIRNLAGRALDQAVPETWTALSAEQLERFQQQFAELLIEEFRSVLTVEYQKTPLECCGHFLRADEAVAQHFYGDKL